MLVEQITVESLGNSSYLVGSPEAGVCAVVDPVRDVDLYTERASHLGLDILYSLETHVHNDFVSGSRELAARTGATVCASGASGLLFDHRPLRHGDSIALGQVRLDVIETPGHTPEHVSYLATDPTDEAGGDVLFSGGALLVGSVARTDLLGKDLAPFLGRWLHRTFDQELKGLDDSVTVYPTHGAGSFCLASPSDSGATVTTIGHERATNPYFRAASADEFVGLALSATPPIPSYYGRMAGLNVRGPRILGGVPTVYPLSPTEVWGRLQRNAVALDIRDMREYASAHIPAALSVPMGGSAGTWVGWLVEEDAQLVMVGDDAAARAEFVRQLIRIGYDSLEGYLDDGMEAWPAARLPVSTTGVVTADELFQRLEAGEGTVPIDVRFDSEWESGHVPEAVHMELGELPKGLDTLSRERHHATVCAAGVRASTAASILERGGIEDVSVLLGGTSAWQMAGLPMDRP